MIGNILDVALPSTPTHMQVNKEELVIQPYTKVHKRTECIMCHHIFSTIYKLNSHMISVHHKGEKTFGCSQCSKLYGTKQGLNEHIRDKHLIVKTHKCRKCFKPCSRLGHIMKTWRLCEQSCFVSL